MVLEILSLGCLASAVAATLWAVRRSVARLPREETRCAGCLTPAHELTNFVCPGCGQDVREQGLERPAPSPAGPVMRWMLAALMYAAVVAMVTALSVGAGQKRYAAKYDLTWDPRSHAYKSLIQQTTFDVGPEGIHQGRSRWILRTLDGGCGVMQVELPSLRYHVVDLAGQSLWEGSALDARAVTQWMQQSGVAITPAVEAEIQEHVEKAREMAAIRGWNATDRRFISRTLSNGGGGGGVSGYPTELQPGISLIISSVGWMLLLVGREVGLQYRRSGRRATGEAVR